MTVHDDDRDEATQPELDALLDTLRQPARPDELIGERDAVAAMVAALASSRQEGVAPVPITKHSRKLAAVGVAAALIVGGVTAAAASVLQGGADNRVEIPAQPAASTSSSEVTTSSSSTTAAPASSTTAATAPASSVAEPSSSTSVPDTTPSTDDSTSATSVECNHGQDVSRVARETEPGPDHGQVVSAAAHDKCEDDTTATSVPDTTATTDDHGGDKGHRGPGGADDHADEPGTSVPGTAATTATTDDHGGDNGNRGPGSEHGASGNSGSGSDGSGHG